jgi:hypothetical protein
MTSTDPTREPNAWMYVETTREVWRPAARV